MNRKRSSEKPDFGFSDDLFVYTECSDIALYSGLNLNQYGVASPCRTICTVCGFVALS
ncbi:hypothetical protein MCC93_17240 [Morococcus cerebrosus]|uniref:Uncharacterized protein n=1 Tax=Morococcus cerebrosus TaxID=1056807 RepID=A0A0C1E4I9_9NEIS|nr:hypothetical protein MCC93_17240 [Morococcus cerebrosus]